MIDDMSGKFKRLFISFVVLTAFVLYFMFTDADNSLGALLITIQIFVVAAVGFWLVEILPDYFIDSVYGKERKLTEKAIESSNGAGMAMIAKSIRILGYSIIVAGAIIAFTSN